MEAVFVFVFSFKASSVKLICIICVCIIAAVGVISLLPSKGAYLNVNKIETPKALSSIDVKKESGRIDYLRELGYGVSEAAPEKTSEKIPEVFDASYESYNDLQRSQGFDLKRYSGKKVTGYTYELLSLPDGKETENERYLVTLIVYKNKVVGADVCCPDNGSIYPLIKPTQTKRM